MNQGQGCGWALECNNGPTLQDLALICRVGMHLTTGMRIGLLPSNTASNSRVPTPVCCAWDRPKLGIGPHPESAIAGGLDGGTARLAQQQLNQEEAGSRPSVNRHCDIAAGTQRHMTHVRSARA
jgi:hypothetical protein